MSNRLQTRTPSTAAHGLVLMLHGGAQHGLEPVADRSLALRRTRWMYRTVAPRLLQEGLAVALLRFTVKGWNDPARPSPVADVRWALAQLRGHNGFEGLRVALLGHSMGARAAVHAADDPAVTGVIGLAPWLPADDPVTQLAGKHLVAAHGSRDRVTSARATRSFLLRADAVAASTRFVDMGQRGHYMVAGLDAWNRVAVAESVAMLRAP